LTLRNCVYEMGAISVTGPYVDDRWVLPLVEMAIAGGCRTLLLEDIYRGIIEVIVAAGPAPLLPDVEWVAPEPEWMDHVATVLDLLADEERARQALVDLGFIVN